MPITNCSFAVGLQSWVNAFWSFLRQKRCREVASSLLSFLTQEKRSWGSFIPCAISYAKKVSWSRFIPSAISYTKKVFQRELYPSWNFLRQKRCRYIPSHFIAFRYITLQCIPLHCIALRYNTFHCITLHYQTCHSIALHCISITSTLHYIHASVHRCMGTWAHGYIHVHTYTHAYTHTYIHT